MRTLTFKLKAAKRRIRPLKMEEREGRPKNVFSWVHRNMYVLSGDCKVLAEFLGGQMAMELSLSLSLCLSLSLSMLSLSPSLSVEW